MDMDKTMQSLAGRRILLAEDEYLIAMELQQELEKNGAEVVGPTASIAETLRLSGSAGPVDVAVLDIDLGGQMAYPVADALRARNIPFIFISGFGPQGIRPEYADAPMLDKPIMMHRLHAFLGETLGNAPRSDSKGRRQ
jgi:DNA-binding response OmpR family regulator